MISRPIRSGLLISRRCLFNTPFLTFHFYLSLQAALPVMPKLHRQLVHELAEHYGIYTKSTDPEPYRHVDLVRRDYDPRLLPEIIRRDHSPKRSYVCDERVCPRDGSLLGEFRRIWQVRTERSDWPSLRLSDAAKVITHV